MATFHNDIVNAYMSASKSTIPTTSTHTRSRERIVGWNDRLLLNWLKRTLYFDITSGSVITHQRMVLFLRLGRKHDLTALRKLKNEDLTLRYDKMSCRVLKNNSKDFWKEVNKVRGNAKT